MVLNFERMLKQYSGYVSNMSEIEFYEKLDQLINKIKAVTEIAKELQDISIEVLYAIKHSAKTNLNLRNITKEKLKKALSVFEKMAELEANSEDEKQFVKVLAEVTKQLIERNPNIRRR